MITLGMISCGADGCASAIEVPDVMRALQPAPRRIVTTRPSAEVLHV